MNNILNKSFILKLSLLVAFNGNVQQAQASHNDNLVTGAVIGVIAVGGICYAIYSCKSPEAQKSRIAAATVAFNRAINSLEQYKLLADRFNLEKANDIEKRAVINKIDEDVLVKLAVPVNQTSHKDYLANLDRLIADLESNKRQLNFAIKVLKNKESYQKEAVDGQLLRNEYGKIIPQLKLLYAFVDNHKSYFKLSKTVNDIKHAYENDVKLLTFTKKLNACLWNIRFTKIEKIKEAVRAYYVDSSYPLKTAVDVLNGNINNIEVGLKSLTFKYTNLRDFAHDLKESLVGIRTKLVNDPEYIKEKRKHDDDKKREQEFKIKTDQDNQKIAIAQQKVINDKLAKDRELEIRANEAAAKLAEAQAALDSAKAKKDMVAQKKIENDIKVYELAMKEAAANKGRNEVEVKKANEASNNDIPNYPPPAYTPPANPADYAAPAYPNLYPSAPPYRG